MDEGGGPVVQLIPYFNVLPRTGKKRTFEENLALASARGKKVAAKAAPAAQLALPHWPEEVRGVPNAILRSALFTVSNESPRVSWRPVGLSQTDIAA